MLDSTSNNRPGRWYYWRQMWHGCLAQKYVWLDFSWGLSVSIAGLIFGSVNILCGGAVRLHPSGSVLFLDAPLMVSGTGVSLGPFLFGGYGFSDFQHEYGHTVQHRLLGPLFYPVVAIPSLLSALSGDTRRHAQLYCERWADAWSHSFHKQNSFLKNI